MKAYWWSGGMAPCILDLSTRWRWEVSFAPWLLYIAKCTTLNFEVPLYNNMKVQTGLWWMSHV